MKPDNNGYRKVFALLFLFLIFKGYCQTSNTNQTVELPGMIPPSPTVASLIKFDDVPVNHYTGVPDISESLISTPIDANLSVNVSLAYHPSGIRVEEYASWAGTGWNISGAGGFVSRVVKGAPDELGGVFSNNYLSSSYQVNTEVFDRINYDNVYAGTGSAGNYKNDTELDVFHYNFFGYSGRFIFQLKNGQFTPILLDKKAKLRIEPSYNGNLMDKFIITDDRGYKYHFEEKEISTIYNLSSSIQVGGNGSPSLNGSEMVYTSSWQISRVEDGMGRLLCTFEYHDVTEKTKSVTDTKNEHFPRYQEIFASVLLYYGISDLLPSLVYPYLMPVSSRTTSTSTISTKKIKKIDIIGRATVDFEIGPGRSDYEDNTGCRLNSVVLKNKQGVQISKVAFEYVNHGTGNRLFLNKIRRQGSAVSIFDETSFAYKDPAFLPKRDSYSKDLWGYYNGSHNIEPFPAMIAPPAAGANMNTHKHFVSSGVLREITYPTGGSKYFEFESNTFHKVQSVPDMVYDILENKIPQYENIVFNCTPNNVPTSNYTSSYKMIYLRHGAFINFNLSVLNVHPSPYGTPSPLAYKVRITPYTNNYPFNPSTDTVSQDLALYSADNSHARDSYSIALNDCLVNGNPSSSCGKTFYISGFYLVEMAGNENRNGNGQALPEMFDRIDYRLNFDWFLYKENHRYNYGGGLRIKSIGFKETPGSTDFRRKYSYEYSSFDEANSSSGSMINLPVFHYIQWRSSMTKDIVYSVIYNRIVPAQVDYVYPFTIKYLTTTSRSQNFLTQGSSVGYRNVRVSDSFEGSINYSYYSPEDFPEHIDVFQYPYTLDMSGGNDYKRGLVFKEEIFDASGKRLRQKDFTYDFVDEPPVYAGCKAYLPQYRNCHMTSSDISGNINSYGKYKSIMSNPNAIYYTNLCGGMYIDFVNIRVQNYIVGWVKRSSVLTTDFYYEGALQHAVATRETYAYNDGNFKPERKDLEKSLGEIITERYYYPGDAQVLGKPFVSELTAKNIIGAPLVTEIYHNNERLSAKETVYKDWDPGSGLFLAPETISTAKGTGALEPRVRYNAMDIATGNPLEVEQAGGTKISYIWGYNKTQPIAKIENMAYAGIPPALVTAAVNASNAIPYVEANLAVALDALRGDSALSGAMVTTYTYKPLVGMSTVTDPKGDRTTYEYDGLNRLQFVRDRDGHILSENQYRYRTQN